MNHRVDKFRRISRHIPYRTASKKKKILFLFFCSFVNDVRAEKAKEFCLWRIDFSDGGRA